jgi:alkylhydroperoxidase family enzyme
MPSRQEPSVPIAVCDPVSAAVGGSPSPVGWWLSVRITAPSTRSTCSAVTPVSGAATGRSTRELMILRIAARAQAAYEWDQHLRIARRAGLADETVLAAATGAWDGLDDLLGAQVRGQPVPQLVVDTLPVDERVGGREQHPVDLRDEVLGATLCLRDCQQ